MNQTKTTPKDFFLHLGATIALYISIGALINVFFSVINYYFPDVLAGYFYANSVAWPISMLIVLVPIFYVLEWLIRRDIRTMSEKSEIWIRKWRIYLTLFLTGAVLAGDLIALINTYLNGEISIRFIYKFLVILVILAVVFTYYLIEKTGKSFVSKKILAYVGIVLVVISIALGFMTVGSPFKQRALRFDNQRINDLQNIQWQIVNYWQQKGKLPAFLASTTDPISGSYIPVDPENKAPYGYTATGPLSFELCTTFALEYRDMAGKGAYGRPIAVDMSYPMVGPNDNWKHGAGYTCFSRTIDPDKYPKIK